MLALRTKQWAGATLRVINNSLEDHTWDADTRLGANAEVSANEVFDDIAAWLVSEYTTHSACVWAASEGEDGKVAYTLTVTGDDIDNWYANSAFANASGWALDGNGAEPWFPLVTEQNDGCVGTLYSSTMALSNWARWNRRKGMVAQRISMNLGSPTVELRRPGLRDHLTEVQCFALRDAISVASSPRAADIYDSDASVWRACKVGSVRIERDGDVLYALGMELLG